MSKDGSDIKLDKLIRKAIKEQQALKASRKSKGAPKTKKPKGAADPKKQKDALNVLLAQPRMIATIDAVSRWAAAKYKQDKDEVRQTLVLKLYDSIDTVKNPKGRAWCGCLKSWLHTVATNEFFNEDRHDKVVKRHEDASASAESERGKRTFPDRGAHPLQSSDPPAQEQELLDKEQKALVRAAFRRVLRLFPRYRKIIELWRDGLSVKEIAARTGASVKKVYRVEGKVVRALMREVEDALGEKRDAA